MLHFDEQNRHEIKDVAAGTLATVLPDDTETFSALSRNGFHIVDMSGEVWTLRRSA